MPSAWEGPLSDLIQAYDQAERERGVVEIGLQGRTYLVTPDPAPNAIFLGAERVTLPALLVSEFLNGEYSGSMTREVAFELRTLDRARISVRTPGGR